MSGKICFFLIVFYEGFGRCTGLQDPADSPDYRKQREGRREKEKKWGNIYRGAAPLPDAALEEMKHGGGRGGVRREET